METNYREVFKKYCLDFMNGEGYNSTEEDIEFAMNHKNEAFELFRNAYDETYGTINIDDNLIDIHTGGWSENEYLISEFKRTEWWRQHLVLTIRGGHYYFDTAGIRGNKEWAVVKKQN